MRKMENFLDINKVAKIVGLPATNEVCPSCDELITAENPLIDTERYTANAKTGYCEGCYDPTPYYPKID